MSRVALLHSPLATERSTAGIYAALAAAGHEPVSVAAGPNLIGRLCEIRPDVVFNNAPGLATKSEQPNIVGMLEMAGYPFTGSGLATQVICQHKGLAKRLLQQAGVATAGFAVLGDRADLARLFDRPELPFTYPALLKPEAEGSSRGISAASVVADRAALAQQAERIWSEFGGAVLVESFLPGREFTVGVLGDPPAALPPVEIVFAGQGFYTHQVKEADAAKTLCPAPATPELTEAVQRLAVAAFRAVDARDYARIDIRLDAAGQPVVIEINAQPGMTPDYSDFPKAAAAGGVPFPQLVARLVELALRRRREQLRQQP
ncbi:MAG: D-alanine--D-alanine ligase family protein [Chloroflexota bacterium]